MFHDPYDLDEQYANGFYRAAPSLGLNPNILGARLDMRTEKALNGNNKIPDFMYFRGHLPGKGEYSFALTEGKYDSLRGGYPTVKNVAWRYFERVLNHPENCHLLDAGNVLKDLTQEELSAKLTTVSSEPGLPEHVRELLVEAARRLDQSPRNILDEVSRPR